VRPVEIGKTTKAGVRDRGLKQDGDGRDNKYLIKLIGN
jgi:hypothetical protein